MYIYVWGCINGGWNKAYIDDMHFTDDAKRNTFTGNYISIRYNSNVMTVDCSNHIVVDGESDTKSPVNPVNFSRRINVEFLFAIYS